MGDEEGVPGLCGRDRELAELLAALHAANSRTRAVFVGGAAGVGKTRLVSELVGIARQRGTTVLTGHAIDIVDAPPFWPVVSAIRNAARSESDDATASLMNRWLAELPLAAGLDDSGLRPSIRLLDSLHQLIVELAAVRPLVLVVEDLQWADRSTRDLLVYLVASLSHETVLIIGTYRDDSPGQASGLNAVLAELRRQRKVSGLELGPLTRTALAELLTRWAPGHPGLEPLVWQRSAGNAFIAEETVRAILGGDTLGLPTTLREVVLSRIAMLSPSAQRVTQAVAAGVGPLPHALLAEVLDQPPAVLLESIREAVKQGIVLVDEDGDGYRLRHGLMTEVVVADLLPGERIEIHRRYALALSGKSEPAQPGLAARLAHHWYEAGDPSRALAATVAAARASERVHAHAEATRHWQRAAELVVRVAAAPRAVQRSECLDRAARAAELAGDHELAVDILDQLLSGQETSGGLASALLTARKASSLAAAGRAHDAREAYGVAVALLPGEGAQAERAQVLSGYSVALLQAMDFAGARTAAFAALTPARSAGASTIEAKTLAVLGFSQAYLEDPVAGSAALAEALAVAERTGEPAAIGEAHLRRVELLTGPLNQLIDGVECARQGVVRMHSLGLARTAGVTLLTHAANALFRLGRWDEAQSTVAEAWALAPSGAAALEVRLARSRLDLGRGRLEAAADDLEAVDLLARSTAGPRHRIPLIVLLAALELWRKCPAEALRHIEEGLTVAEAGADDIWSLAPLVWHGTRAWADTTTSGLPPPSPIQIRRLKDHQAELARRGSNAVPAIRSVVETFTLMCAAETARAEDNPDAGAWERVTELWERHHQPYPAAYARLRRAEALLSRHSRAAAASDDLRNAERIARRLGAEPLLADIVDLAARARVSLDGPVQPESRVPAQRRVGRGPLDALTARELEVLTELATGLTNREIAHRLFISEKTVGVHISRIYMKIGVHSRVQASAVLQRSRPASKPR
ncbi:DNA-binding CsgD family transcriptional regulator/tetratricopeptide (TPR) repeat protein [Pseudonocardia eucalypti]|uniref:AAA family ATPase n=1 Tax=Pseudonocardia eucalypti TaxID=648755 RepID=UPI001607E18E|nr:DNA-binding CsgD family transcriptional regulator/tetratricopeptide (TPR) repeat protein [Pseudonocardia eucalypti]